MAFGLMLARQVYPGGEAYLAGAVNAAVALPSVLLPALLAARARNVYRVAGKDLKYRPGAPGVPGLNVSRLCSAKTMQRGARLTSGRSTGSEDQLETHPYAHARQEHSGGQPECRVQTLA